MARGKIKEVKSILDSFDSIKKADKRAFVKAAEKMGIGEEELLSLAIQAVVKGKVKFETKKTYEIV